MRLVLLAPAIPGLGFLAVSVVASCSSDPSPAAPVCDAACEGGAGADAVAPVDGGRDRDAGPDAGEPEPGDAGRDATSFCEGITFYARFDGDTKSTQGDDPARLEGASVIAAGKLGGALSLPNAAVAYYSVSVPPETPLRWRETSGTLALWFRPQWAFAKNGPHVLVRQSATTNEAALDGPAFIHTKGELGFGLPETKPRATTNGDAWKEKDWNHLVGTWAHADDVLSLALNGGDPVRLAMTWDTDEAGLFLRLGSELAPADGDVDDVALWRRVLDPIESRALFDAAQVGRSIGDVCGLK